ncbi:14523_t:CDS:10 [Ambispora leptoticha]|uniref:SUN-like protein 1 n=1 Tax=Ambispora leptoticha TaxID=144679 RepID=A0A9N8V864_9GLOM|nr:14523_t:CDS:10 [Ambispora leptoticha]
MRSSLRWGMVLMAICLFVSFAMQASAEPWWKRRNGTSSGSSSIIVDPLVGPAIIQMTTPAVTQGKALYKIGSQVTFGWKYQSTPIIKPQVLNLLTQASTKTWYTIAQNISASATSYIWDTSNQKNPPLVMADYTLYITDERGINAPATAGRLEPFNGLVFSLYLPQSYTPLDAYTCATCYSDGSFPLIPIAMTFSVTGGRETESFYINNENSSNRNNALAEIRKLDNDIEQRQQPSKEREGQVECLKPDNHSFESLLWKSTHCQSCVAPEDANNVSSHMDINSNKDTISHREGKKYFNFPSLFAASSSLHFNYKEENKSNKKSANSNNHQSILPFVEWRKDTLKKEVTKQQLAVLTNHASLDCAASILKANPEAKGTHAILSESKDFYMLNKCNAQKYIVVELCEDILIKSFVLANFEFFSSTFKEFRVSISNRYPPSPTSNDGKNDDGWHLLGEFKAKNSREMQLFEVRDPVIWARYLRIDFLTHYGNQVYCPVSLLRVHGTTMIEEYKNHEENIRMNSDESIIGDQSPRIYSPPYDEITDSTSKDENSLSSNNQISLNSDKPTTTITATNTKTVNLPTTIITYYYNTSPPPPYTGSGGGSGTLSVFQKIQNKISNLEANATFFRRYLEEQGNLLADIWKRYQESETKWQQVIWGLNQTVEMLTKSQEQTLDALKRIENDVRLNDQHISILKSDLHRLYIQSVLVEYMFIGL